MGERLAAAASGLVESPLFGITLTLVAYQLALVFQRRCGGRAIANPVLVSILLVGASLTVFHIPYQKYWTGAQFIGFLLGPATVALGLPLARQAGVVRRAAVAILAGVVVGAGCAIAAALVVTRWAGGSEQLARSMAPKSATTPIAITLAESIGGVAALAAVFAVLTGIIGAVVGPALLDLIRVRDPRWRGLAIGLSSHGIGTSRALQEGEVTGAFSGLAMGLSTLVTSVLLPLVLALLP